MVSAASRARPTTCATTKTGSVWVGAIAKALHHRHEHVEVEGKARAHRVDAAPRAGETEAVASEQGDASLQSGAMSRLVDPYATAPAVT